MNKNKGFVGLMLLIILGAIVIAGGAYYLGKNSLKEKNIVTVDEENSGVAGSKIPVVSNSECTSTSTPSVRVISPNGGEMFKVGEQINIKWTSCNVSYTDNNIVVALHKDGAWENVIYLSEATLNDGSESFSIPSNVSAGNYKIRVGSSVAKVQQDYSDSQFVINSAATKTYIYKNHGFTIELPKDYIPHEEQAEGGPAIIITLPNGSGINYLTDMGWWNKVDYFGDKSHLRDEKIGETIFKVYKEKNSNVIIYSYIKGNVGYVFYGDKKLLETFKFVGWN